MDLFKRWRRSRSGQITDSAMPNVAAQSVVNAAASPPGLTSPSRPRRPATMGRSAAEQAYLAQAATRAKQD